MHVCRHRFVGSCVGVGVYERVCVCMCYLGHVIGLKNICRLWQRVELLLLKLRLEAYIKMIQYMITVIGNLSCASI